MTIPPRSEHRIDAASIPLGTPVQSQDGESLGQVAEVWAETPAHGYVPASQFAIGDYGPVSGNQQMFEGAAGYMQVRALREMRLENDHDLFIPLSAVREVNPEHGIVLTCRQEECRERYSQRPAELNLP